MDEIVILGAGISGISAAFHLKQEGLQSSIYEKNASWGGLCDNFEIDGFRFDKFVHLSFTTDDYVKKIFKDSTEYYTHEPNPVNYYHGKWLKHPAQNNLYPLDVDEKIQIIQDFITRPGKDISQIHDYEEWLIVQYGDYFARNFPMIYTWKYWTTKAAHLETKWVGKRMYKPTIEEVLKGAMSEDTPQTYYAKEMRYPTHGGYKSFLNSMIQDLDFKLNKRITKIEPDRKVLTFASGTTVGYSHMISSLPLPEICSLIKDCPAEVLAAAEKLKWTSGALISLGFNKPDIARNLWFYIYDEDILPARVYSPSLKSQDNVPSGCSSLQAEIYFSKEKPLPGSLPEIMEQTISQFIDIGLFKSEDLVVKDIRTEDYANIIFDHEIYENKKIVKEYLESLDIISVGRFGEWAYYWSDQSLLSGKRGAEKLCKRLKI